MPDLSCRLLVKFPSPKSTLTVTAFTRHLRQYLLVVQDCDTRSKIMGGKVLLVLKQKPSFEGELSIRLIEERDSEGRIKYSVVCQKKPPLKVNEFAVFAKKLNRIAGQDFEEITKSIDWEREVPTLEAKRIAAALQHKVVSLVPESVFGLDGTAYELLVERGFNSIQFTWWAEPPAAWQALRELSTALLDLANAASVIEAQQSNKRKQLIQQLQQELDDEVTRLRNERTEMVQTQNRRCQEMARSLRKAGLRCPNCGVWSSDIRFIDKSPAGKSCFICNSCGRSFRPEDL